MTIHLLPGKRDMDIPIDPGWGIAAGLATFALSTAAAFWRIAAKVGAATTRLEAIEKRQDGADLRMVALDQAHRQLDTALARLPGEVADRFDRKLDEATSRIEARIDKVFLKG